MSAQQTKLLLSASLLVAPSLFTYAQEPATKPPREMEKTTDANESARGQVTSPPKAVKEQITPLIADNSFLIEEAYHREPGIVQHIVTCLVIRQPQQDVARANVTTGCFLSVVRASLCGTEMTTSWAKRESVLTHLPLVRKKIPCRACCNLPGVSATNAQRGKV